MYLGPYVNRNILLILEKTEALTKKCYLSMNCLWIHDINQSQLN